MGKKNAKEDKIKEFLEGWNKKKDERSGINESIQEGGEKLTEGAMVIIDTIYEWENR